MKKIDSIWKLRAAYMLDDNVYSLHIFALVKDIMKHKGIEYQSAQEIIQACKRLQQNASTVEQVIKSSEDPAKTSQE